MALSFLILFAMLSCRLTTANSFYFSFGFSIYASGLEFQCPARNRLPNIRSPAFSVPALRLGSEVICYAVYCGYILQHKPVLMSKALTGKPVRPRLPPPTLDLWLIPMPMGKRLPSSLEGSQGVKVGRHKWEMKRGNVRRYRQAREGAERLGTCARYTPLPQRWEGEKIEMARKRVGKKVTKARERGYGCGCVGR